MRHKSGPRGSASEKAIKTSAERPASTIQLKRRSALFWMGYAVKRPSPSFAGASRSFRASIANGRKSSSKRVSVGLPAIPHDLPRPTRSRSFAVRQGS